jgi:hypothetical protein
MLTTSPDMLEAIRAAIQPYVLKAASTAPAPPAATTVRLYLAPFRLEVAHHDRAGRVCLFRATGDLELAELTAEFLTAGVRELPETIRHRVCRLLAAGRAEMITLVDMDLGTVGGVLVPSGDADPVLLFALRHQETRH